MVKISKLKNPVECFYENDSYEPPKKRNSLGLGIFESDIQLQCKQIIKTASKLFLQMRNNTKSQRVLIRLF